MIIYLVWSSYEDVEAAFLDKAKAEQWIDKYLQDNPTYGGYRDRTRDDLSITDIELHQ